MCGRKLSFPSSFTQTAFIYAYHTYNAFGKQVVSSDAFYNVLNKMSPSTFMISHEQQIRIKRFIEYFLFIYFPKVKLIKFKLVYDD